MAADTSGNIFITGVHDASYSLPYTGDSYIMKTDPDGVVLWTEYITGSVQIGDMATVGNSAVIVGKSNGAFVYQGEQYGSVDYFMFIMKIDSVGTIEWYVLDENSFGANTNLAVGKFGKIAVHVRGQYNLGDWVWILAPDGNILNTKEINSEASTISDMAYYNGWVYLNGTWGGFGSMIVDTIVINTPPVESATFTLALDPDLVAKWVVVDTTLASLDGRIVANGSGIFVYELVLEPIFTLKQMIKKINFQGQILAEIEAPQFTTAVALYPDMVVTPGMLGLFVANQFDFNSHKVILMDHNLNILSEKYIDGTSHGYSGQITSYGDDIFVSHVYSDNLEFDDELSLPYLGSGKLPYIAKIGTPSITAVQDKLKKQDNFFVYPNPADESKSISFKDQENSIANITIQNIAGKVVLTKYKHHLDSKIDLAEIQAGVYIIKVQLDSGLSLHRKLIIQ